MRTIKIGIIHKNGSITTWASSTYQGDIHSSIQKTILEGYSSKNHKGHYMMGVKSIKELDFVESYEVDDYENTKKDYPIKRYNTWIKLTQELNKEL